MSSITPSHNDNEPHLDNLHIIAQQKSSIQKLSGLLSELGFKVTKYEDARTSASPNSFLLIDIDGIELESLKKFLKENRKTNPQNRVGLCCSAKSSGLVPQLKSSDFDDLFRHPTDEEFILDSVYEYMKEPQKSSLYDVHHPGSDSMSAMAQVQIPDLASDEPLAFDVYLCLPHNQKFIMYRRQGAPLEAATREKLLRFKKFSLFVKKADLKKYYRHGTDILQKSRQNASLTQLERDREVRKHLRDLMGEVTSAKDLTPDALSAHIYRIDRSLENLEPAPPAKLQELTRELSMKHLNYHGHSRNVASYCRIFACALGQKDLREIYIGGLLHDLGMSDLPTELLGLSISEMSETQLSQYKLHPGNGKLALIEKGNHFSERVQKMILHHHERADGKGFPYGAKNDEIDIPSKICAIADEFDYLTSLRIGQSTFSPEQAMQKIREQATTGRFDLTLVNVIESLFKPGAQAQSPLHEVVTKVTDLSTLKELLSKPNIDINHIDHEGVTAVSETAARGNLDALKLLVDAGADLNCANIDGSTPLMRAIDSGHVNVVEFLLTKATSDGGKKIVDATVCNRKGQTVLMQLAAKGTTTHFENLVRLGADIKAKDFEGTTALMCAVRGGHVEAAQALIKQGADPKDTDRQGRNLIYYAIESEQVATVQFCLDQSVDISVKAKSVTPLMLASFIGNLDIVRALVAAGMRVNEVDRQGRTAVQYAEIAQKMNIKEFLLKRAK